MYIQFDWSGLKTTDYLLAFAIFGGAIPLLFFGLLVVMFTVSGVFEPKEQAIF